jgi:hypothetical protein
LSSILHLLIAYPAIDGSQSPPYTEFLSILGNEINLLNFGGYNGGLDTGVKKRTGDNSVYTEFRGFEIMYHVVCRRRGGGRREEGDFLSGREDGEGGLRSMGLDLPYLGNDASIYGR